MTPPSLLFLDVDGVLNSHAWFILDPDHNTRVPDPAAVALVNKITDRTGAHLVISSVWRFHYKTLTALREGFKGFGLTGKVLGMTPKVHKERGEEIQLWFEQFPNFKGLPFAILDDNSDMAPFMDRLVQTKMSIGITTADVERVLTLLAGVQ